MQIPLTLVMALTWAAQTPPAVVFPQTGTPAAFPQNAARPQMNALPPNVSFPQQRPGRFPLQPSSVMPIVPPSPPQRRTQQLRQFDPQSTRLHWVNNRWVLRSGDTFLKDFGQRYQDGREALRVIQRLKLSQRGAIGNPLPIMEFWLADGKAPKTLGSGLRLSPIETESLRVEKIHGNWCIRDNQQILFNFGIQKACADQAVDVMRRYRFSQVGYVGFPRPVMIYFTTDSRALRKASFQRPLMTNQTGNEKQPPGFSPTGQRKNSPQSGNQRPSVDEKRLLQYQLLQLARGARQLAPPVTATTAHVQFDPRQLVIRQIQNRWKLYAGNLVVADFGMDFNGAEEAVRLLRSHDCNEYCLIGQPTSSFSYFLAHGSAPRGIRLSLEGIHFRPDKITVRQSPAGWNVCEGERTLFQFGNRQADAAELAAAIRQHRFDFYTPLGDRAAFLARRR